MSFIAACVQSKTEGYVSQVRVCSRVKSRGNYPLVLSQVLLWSFQRGGGGQHRGYPQMRYTPREDRKPPPPQGGVTPPRQDREICPPPQTRVPARQDGGTPPDWQYSTPLPSHRRTFNLFQCVVMAKHRPVYARVCKCGKGRAQHSNNSRWRLASSVDTALLGL